MSYFLFSSFTRSFHLIIQSNHMLCVLLLSSVQLRTLFSELHLMLWWEGLHLLCCLIVCFVNWSLLFWWWLGCYWMRSTCLPYQGWHWCIWQQCLGVAALCFLNSDLFLPYFLFFLHFLVSWWQRMSESWQKMKRTAVEKNAIGVLLVDCWDEM